MDHAPALFPQFANLIENGNTLIALDELTKQTHRNESTSATNSSAAVNNWNAPLSNCIQELIN
jgi:hypothetical protein